MNNGENWTEGTYAAAEAAIGHAFRDRALLLACFTHKSYANAFGGEHNERLEFLGDAVLELLVTERLLRENADDEGVLTERRKRYVSKSALEQAERRAGLMRFLRYSGGESNVRGKTSSNLFEAVVAGLYLDGGLGAAAEFLDKFLSEIETENYKTMLQEYVQERRQPMPVYTLRETENGFGCTVSALGKHAEGEGENKKTAETVAARRLYAMLTGGGSDL